MAEITAAMVRALREETSQGMMECKKALTETNGDFEKAKDLLRARGLVKAEKKAARATSEGLVEILIADDLKSVTMVEVNCETDFCSRNDVFRAMAREVARLASKEEAGEIVQSEAIKASVTDALNKIGENMQFVRGYRLMADQVGAYQHHNHKVGVIIAVQGQVDRQTLSEICMHIAFHNPMGVTRDDISADVIEHEKVIAKAQAMEQGKPENIAEKMVVGKINKFYAENCLLEQPFVKDETKTVKEVLGSAKVVRFVRYEVGGMSPASTEQE